METEAIKTATAVPCISQRTTINTLLNYTPAGSLQYEISCAWPASQQSTNNNK